MKKVEKIARMEGKEVREKIGTGEITIEEWIAALAIKKRMGEGAKKKEASMQKRCERWIKEAGGKVGHHLTRR